MCVCSVSCVGVCDMFWWGSWSGLLVGGTLIWHALSGTALPSYSTDSHCPGNRSSNSRTQSTHRFIYQINTHPHSHKQTYTLLLRQCSFWSRFGTGGDRWVNSGSLGCHHSKSKGTHAHIHTSHTNTLTHIYTQDHWLTQTWSESSKHTARLKCSRKSLTHTHTQGHTLAKPRKSSCKHAVRRKHDLSCAHTQSHWEIY